MSTLWASTMGSTIQCTLSQECNSFCVKAIEREYMEASAHWQRPREKELALWSSWCSQSTYKWCTHIHHKKREGGGKLWPSLENSQEKQCILIILHMQNPHVHVLKESQSVTGLVLKGTSATGRPRANTVNKYATTIYQYYCYTKTMRYFLGLKIFHHSTKTIHKNSCF